VLPNRLSILFAITRSETDTVVQNHGETFRFMACHALANNCDRRPKHRPLHVIIKGTVQASILCIRKFKRYHDAVNAAEKKSKTIMN
jgi:hypothetical protein